MCPSVVVYAVDHIVAPSPSNNTRKICIWICAWNNYVSYTLVWVHFIVCSMYVSSCSTPSFSSPASSSPANSAIPSDMWRTLSLHNVTDTSITLGQLWAEQTSTSLDLSVYAAESEWRRRCLTRLDETRLLHGLLNFQQYIYVLAAHSSWTIRSQLYVVK